MAIDEMKVERLVDETIIRELEKNGFLDQALGGKTASR